MRGENIYEEILSYFNNVMLYRVIFVMDLLTDRLLTRVQFDSQYILRLIFMLTRNTTT